MFNIEFQKVVLATVGAIVLTTVSVGAAVGPARVAETTPVLVASLAPAVADRANV